jgi:hypothetical protein
MRNASSAPLRTMRSSARSGSAGARPPEREHQAVVFPNPARFAASATVVLALSVAVPFLMINGMGYADAGTN